MLEGILRDHAWPECLQESEHIHEHDSETLSGHHALEAHHLSVLMHPCLFVQDEFSSLEFGLHSSTCGVGSLENVPTLLSPQGRPHPIFNCI